MCAVHHCHLAPLPDSICQTMTSLVLMPFIFAMLKAGGDLLGNGYGGASHAEDLLAGLSAGPTPQQQQSQYAPAQPQHQQQYPQQQYVGDGGVPFMGSAPPAAPQGQQGPGASGGMRAGQRGPPPGQAKADPFANLL